MPTYPDKLKRQIDSIVERATDLGVGFANGSMQYADFLILRKGVVRRIRALLKRNRAVILNVHSSKWPGRLHNLQNLPKPKTSK